MGPSFRTAIVAIVSAGSLALAATRAPAQGIPRAQWGDAPVGSIIASIAFSPSGRPWLLKVGVFTADSLDGAFRLSLDPATNRVVSDPQDYFGVSDLIAFATDSVAVLGLSNSHDHSSPTLLFRTADAGATWRAIDVPGLNWINAVAGGPDGSIWVLARADPKVLMLTSTDGGVSWSRREIDMRLVYLTGIERVGTREAYASTMARDGGPALWHTGDAGATWTPIKSPHDAGLQRVDEGYVRVRDMAVAGNTIVVHEFDRAFVADRRTLAWRALPDVRHVAGEADGQHILLVRPDGASRLVDAELRTVWTAPPSWSADIEQVVLHRGVGYFTSGDGAIERVHAGRVTTHQPIGPSFPMRVEEVSFSGTTLLGRTVGSLVRATDTATQWERAADLPPATRTWWPDGDSLVYLVTRGGVGLVDLRTGSATKPREFSMVRAARHTVEEIPAFVRLGSQSLLFAPTGDRDGSCEAPRTPRRLLARGRTDTTWRVIDTVEDGAPWFVAIGGKRALAMTCAGGLRIYAERGDSAVLERAVAPSRGDRPRFSGAEVVAGDASGRIFFRFWQPYHSREPVPPLHSLDAGRTWVRGRGELADGVAFGAGLLHIDGDAVLLVNGDARHRALARDATDGARIVSVAGNEDGTRVAIGLHSRGAPEVLAQRWELISPRRLIADRWEIYSVTWSGDRPALTFLKSIR